MVDYLTEVFVGGGYLTFGTQKAVCNISPLNLANYKI